MYIDRRTVIVSLSHKVHSLWVDFWVYSKVKEKSADNIRAYLNLLSNDPCHGHSAQNQLNSTTNLNNSKERDIFSSWRVEVSCWKSIFCALLTWPPVNPLCCDVLSRVVRMMPFIEKHWYKKHKWKCLLINMRKTSSYDSNVDFRAIMTTYTTEERGSKNSVEYRLFFKVRSLRICIFTQVLFTYISLPVLSK